MAQIDDDYVPAVLDENEAIPFGLDETSPDFEMTRLHIQQLKVSDPATYTKIMNME